MQKTEKMTETLAHGFSSESTQWEAESYLLVPKWQDLKSCALDESSLSIGRVNNYY